MSVLDTVRADAASYLRRRARDVVSSTIPLPPQGAPVSRVPVVGPPSCTQPRQLSPGQRCEAPRSVLEAARRQGGQIGGELWCADHRCLEQPAYRGDAGAGPGRRFYIGLINAGLYGFWHQAKTDATQPGMQRAANEASRLGKTNPAAAIEQVRYLAQSAGYPVPRVGVESIPMAAAACETADCPQQYQAPGTIPTPRAPGSPSLPAPTVPRDVAAGATGAGYILLATGVLAAVLFAKSRKK